MPPKTEQAERRRGFALVELLVVVGIISILIAMLLPAMIKAQHQARWIQCQSNLRQCGQFLEMYSNQWRGWCFPPKRGTTVPREQRWPVVVFKPAVYDPPCMLCPADFEPVEQHSYVLNGHLAERKIKFGSRHRGGKSSSEILLMGEKLTYRNDYYLDSVEYDHIIERYRHGPHLGSNYLFLDCHVEAKILPQNSASYEGDPIDPWDPGDEMGTVQIRLR